MVDFFTLNTRVYVIGNTVDPVVHYYADSDKTINVILYDINGSQISSTQYNVSSGVNVLQLGDWLSAQTLSEGYYVLQIGSGYVTIVVSQGSISPLEPLDKIKKVIVYDKVTGLYLDLPVDSPLWPYGSSRFMTFIYYHDDDKKLGKLHIVDGTSEIDTDWARYAIVEISIRFNTIDDLYNYVVRYVNTSSRYAAEVIGKIANSSKEDASKIASLYQIQVPFGDLLNWSIDIGNLEIRIDIAVRLGWGWSKAWSVLKYVAAGAIAGAGIAAAIGVAVGTFGAGTIVGGAIGGAALGLAYKLVSSDNDKDWNSKIRNSAQQGINNVTKATNDAFNVLDYYHQQGQITDEAYNELKKSIENIKLTAIKAIKEVEEEAEKCYEAGYSDCRKKYVTFVVGAGLGGFLLGSLRR